MLYAIEVCLKGVQIFLFLYSWLIVIDATFTLFSRPKDSDTKLKQILRKTADPINNVYRRALRKYGAATLPIDLTPLLSLITIWVLSAMFNQLSKRIYELFF